MGAAKDVQSRLQASSLIDGATGWPSSRAVVHDDTDRLVTITDAGGPQPGTRTGNEDPAVQIRVRGNPHEADGAIDKLRAIRDDLQGLTNVTLGATTYIEVSADNEPALMEIDDKQRPTYVQTFTLQR